MRDARLSHMVTCLGHHSRYLYHFVKTLDFLMNGNGPLRLDIRSYVAILVSRLVGGVSVTFVVGSKQAQMLLSGEHYSTLV